MTDHDMPRKKFVVEHSNFFNPEDLYRFIHLDSFEGDWNELGLDDDDLGLLQIQIMVDPLEPPIISGTGGLRRQRFSPPPKGGEKRKIVEVLYAVFSDFSVAVLAAAANDGEIEELTDDIREALRVILEDIEDALESGR